MARIIEIKDLSLPELAAYTRLKDPPYRAGWEAENGIFIAENPKVIDIAMRAGYTPLSLLSERRHIEGTARGVLCAMWRKAPPPVEDICSGEGEKLVAVAENITDAANLGALFRNAAALGADAVLLSPGCCDPLSRRCLRVSMGTVFQVPWARFDADKGWPVPALEFLRSLGFVTAALALSDEAVSLDDRRLRAPRKLAVLLGTEGDGLSVKTLTHCDLTVKIPMMNGVDSLNVAAAGAVAFWELRKHR